MCNLAIRRASVGLAGGSFAPEGREAVAAGAAQPARGSVSKHDSSAPEGRTSVSGLRVPGVMDAPHAFFRPSGAGR